MQAVLNTLSYNMIQFAFASGKFLERSVTTHHIGLNVKKTLSVPETGAKLDNLAGLYRDQSRYQRTLTIYELAFPENHPWIARALENYANLLQRMHRPEEAEQLQTRARASQLGEKKLTAELTATTPYSWDKDKQGQLHFPA